MREKKLLLVNLGNIFRILLPAILLVVTMSSFWLLNTIAAPFHDNISDYHTVKFVVGGGVYEEKQVGHGLLAPAVANPPAPSDTPDKIFAHWTYELDTEIYIFDFTTDVITSDLTLTASFQHPDHLVSFFSDDGLSAIVAYSVPAANNTTIPLVHVDGIAPPNEFFFEDRWLIKGTTTEFVFSSTLITSDLDLVPLFEPGHTVWFNTKGGTLIEPQFIKNVDPIIEPVAPTKQGYSFAGWYEEETLTTQFTSFNAVIAQNYILYAKWNPVTVNYTVNYWLEKAGIPVNDDVPGGGLSAAQRANASNFSLVNREVRTGLTDSTVTIPEVSVPTSIINDIRVILKSIKTTAPAETRDFAHYARSTSVTVKGDGTTTVDVYYERNVIDVIFNLGTSNTIIKSMTITENGTSTTYYPGPLSSQYAVQAKIGLPLAIPNPYDQEGDVTVSIVGQIFDGWGPTGIQLGPPTLEWLYHLLDIPFSNSSTNSQFVYNMRSNPASPSLFFPFEEHWMLESLDQTSPVNEAFGRYYFEGKYFEDIINGYTKGPLNSEYGAFVPHGFSPYWRSGDLGKRYGYKAISGSPTTFIIDDVQPRPVSAFNPYFKEYFFYVRDRYSLTFDLQGGSMPSPSVINGVLYGSDTGIHEPPQDPTRGDDIFLGWFEETGVKYDFSTETMPASNLLLTAKWLINPKTITFHPDPTGNTDIPEYTQIVETNGTVVDPGALNPTDWGRPSNYVFLGWYIKLSNGIFTPYHFDQPVVEDLALYARWDPPFVPFNITYDINGGSVSSGSLPIDNTRYTEGSKVKLLSGTNLSRDNEIFIGWKIDGTGDWYQGGNTITMPVGGLTLVAQYAPTNNALLVTFNPNQGQGTITNWNAVLGAAVTFPTSSDLNFVRQGYKFLGWSTDPGSIMADNNFAPNKKYTLNDNLTLYAIWSKIPNTPNTGSATNTRKDSPTIIVIVVLVIAVLSLSRLVVKWKRSVS